MSTFKWVILTGTVLIGIPVTLSYISTFNTVATAPARVVNKTLDENNIIFNYERFFDINSNYTSRLKQVEQYKKLYANEEDKVEKVNLRTELAAMQQSCRELANEYNADSRKMNRYLFKSNELPYTLDASACE